MKPAMDAYSLTRDDGARLIVSAGAWEAALEIAFVCGWRPAGTSAPRGANLRAGKWDVHDYFTRQSQRVEPKDALRLGDALQLGLQRDPAWLGSAKAQGPLRSLDSDASRLTDLAPKGAMRTLLQRLAVFAQTDGFMIRNAQ